MMSALAAPILALFAVFARYPWPSIATCAILSAICYALNWGDLLALFACAGSAILIWKNEADQAAIAAA
ncbi:hypothetical protein IAI18_20945 [Acetobacteraceae bacterium H6797]|nr:hypothetical protein [Acetobacteraceae bacterium H6797]